MMQFDLTEYKILLEVGEVGRLKQTESQTNRYRPSIEQISLEKIREKIKRKQEVRRVVFSCSLALNKAVTISIRGFQIFSDSGCDGKDKEKDVHANANGKNDPVD